MGRSAQPPAAELAEKWKDQKWQKDDWQKDDPERGTVFRPMWADKKIGIDGNRLRTDGNRRMNRHMECGDLSPLCAGDLSPTT